MTRPALSARRPGRPRVGARARLVLTMALEDHAELLALAHGRQITAFLLDCVRYATAHRPASRVERPVSTVYVAQPLPSDGGPIMQVVRDTYQDGRAIERYTGIEYATLTAAQRDCAQLNRRPSRAR
jgi:hypothetical protein